MRMRSLQTPMYKRPAPPLEEGVITDDLFEMLAPPRHFFPEPLYKNHLPRVRISTVTCDRQTSASPRTEPFCQVPMELWLEIFEHLDFQSLCRMLQTSVTSKHLVESYPPYQGLMRHIPHILAVLSENSLLKHLRASKIHLALLTQDCMAAGCLNRGSLLYFFTADRLCFTCLASGRYSIQSLAIAKAYKVEQLTGQPALRLIPALYKIRWEFSCTGQEGDEYSCGFPLHIMRERCEERYGTKALKECDERIFGFPFGFSRNRRSWHTSRPFRYDKDGSLVNLPPAFHMDLGGTYYDALQPDERWGDGPMPTNSRISEFPLEATYEIPWISPNGELDWGHRCLGCAVNLCFIEARDMPLRTDIKTPPRLRVGGSALGMAIERKRRYDLNLEAACVQWTKPRLLEHFRTCAGIRYLVETKLHNEIHEILPRERQRRVVGKSTWAAVEEKSNFDITQREAELTGHR